MNDIHLFRAASTREAFALVKEALGEDAIILRTQRHKAGWWPWSRHSLVEVEAMSDVAAIDDWNGANPADSTTNGGLTHADIELLRSRERISKLEQMISELSVSSSRDSDSIPAELFQTFTDLLDAGVEHSDARDLVTLQSAGHGSSMTGEVARASIKEAIAGALACHGPIEAKSGRRRVAALVGPTGVGKTTTIAKLASNFHLKDHIKTGLITTDTFRSAAVDQLRAYSDALGLPLEVAGNAEQLQSALHRLQDCELVLIDTAGKSPRDEPRLNELRSLLKSCRIDEIHLVLSLTASPRTMTDLADQFRSLGLTALLLTKLDEAAGAGTVYSAARRVGCPVSYITTGQAVPDDIELLDSRRLSGEILRDGRAGTSRPRDEDPLRTTATPESVT